jgi:DNA uptake protein ComE-like DNA-binding protein
LVVVLLVIALLSLSAYTFSDMMLVEHAAAQAHADMAKTRETAASGVALIQAYLMQDPQVRIDLGGIYDNPTYFARQPVHIDEDPAFQTLCMVTSSAFDSDGRPAGVRHGLENESGRLNLNWLLELSDKAAGDAAEPEDGSQAPAGGADDEPETTSSNSTGDPGRDALTRLPGMTLEIADAILDWIDSDDEPREYGAEIDYYSSIDPPYRPRNGPIGSVDELLMVRGVTPDLLFGRDQNRNGMVDESETNLQIYAEVDETQGSIDLGWATLLTTYSAELPPQNPNGEARIDLNGDDIQALVDELSGVINAEWATFIGAYRRYGPYTGDDQGVAIGGASIDFSASGQGDNSIESILDLIDARVEVPGTTPKVYRSPFPSGSLSSDFMLLQDYVTTAASDEVVTGRININEATYSVLMAIPKMTENVASTIVSQRDPTLDPTTSPRRHPTWLLAEGLVDLETMREMLPFLTTGGDIYRAQVTGFFGDGTGVSRLEVVLDATRPDIPVLLWNDQTDLGRGFDPAILVGTAAAPSP